MVEGELLLVMLAIFYVLGIYILDDMTTVENIKLLLILGLAVFMGNALYDWLSVFLMGIKIWG